MFALELIYAYSKKGNRIVSMGNLLLKLFVKDYKKVNDHLVQKKYGFVASLFGLVTNFLLFVSKIVIGIILGLFSLVSDSINNLSDFGNNLLSVFGVKVTFKPADKEHPYGHQRTEYIISLIIGCVIIALGAVMAYQGITDLISFCKSMIEIGRPLSREFSYVMYVTSLCLLSLAILVKVTQSSIYFSYGKKISSQQLKALGKDALNDCISTSLVIVGILISYFTGYDVDCFFTLFVAVLVTISGIGIIKEAANSLLGEKPSQELIDSLVSLLLKHKGVLGIHDLELHTYGKAIFGVIHVEVDAKEDVMLSHELCDQLEKEVFSLLHIHLTVHMDPVLVDDPDTDKYKKLLEEFISKTNKDIHYHDFRIISGKENVNLVFDMIVPTEMDNPEGHKKIKTDLYSFINNRYGKQVHIVINFDDAVSDFLSGTQAEK